MLLKLNYYSFYLSNPKNLRNYFKVKLTVGKFLKFVYEKKIKMEVLRYEASSVYY